MEHPEHTSTDSKEKPDTSIKEEVKTEEQPIKETPKYFECSSCFLNEKYEYFGRDPPFVKHYNFEENVYLIEDPFLPPKQAEFIILGSHCTKCQKQVCRDPGCSFFFDGTYCINCARNNKHTFPQPVKDKLDKVVPS